MRIYGNMYKSEVPFLDADVDFLLDAEHLLFPLSEETLLTY